MPKHAAAMKGKVLALELWMESSETPTPGSRAVKGSSLSKKRKSTGGNATKENDETTTKRPRTSEPIESTFQRLLPGPGPAKSTEIEIVLAHIAVDLESCCVQVSWPDDNTPTKKALISDIIFKSGKMKHCYKLSIGGEQYVAKRFQEIGHGEDEVTLAENSSISSRMLLAFLWTPQQQDYGNHHIRPNDHTEEEDSGVGDYGPKGLRDGATSMIAMHSASVSTWSRDSENDDDDE
ncbi:hypothetical protein B0H13DRAFT_2395103 [Mycena leptocephala]|nr:hypothetical protein B0H13DRAFT_2395103 [Mycena leptocephala]